MNELIILGVLLILSGFFSGSETALTSISRARAEALAKEGLRGSKALITLKENTTRMLVIILVGNNLVNIGASALATVLATEWFGHLGPGIAVGALTVLILVFGEVTPKSWAAMHAERISLFAAPIILNFGRAVLPAVWVLERFAARLHRMAGVSREPTVTESEVLSLLTYGAEEGTIEDDEIEMIERVFAFNDSTVRDVMTPRNEVFSLDGSLSIREALPFLVKGSVSRVPVYNQAPDDVIGVIYLRDVLQALVDNKAESALRTIAHEPLFVPQTQTIDELFDTLRKTKRHLALVVNEYGMLQGVVTLEDLLEELVGEIYDESDRPDESIKEVSEGRVQLSGLAEMRALLDYFDVELPDCKPTDTVSLWLLNHSGRIPASNENFDLDGFSVRVLQASRRFIQLVEIQRLTPDSNGLEDSAAEEETSHSGA